MTRNAGSQTKRKGSFSKRSGGGSRGFKRGGKKRSCLISAEKNSVMDYKDAEFLSKLLSDKGKIFPRSHTGASAKKQRELARAIKKSRAAGLLKVSR